MGKLIYGTITSLDGFTEDATGSFDWSVPDDDVHLHWNEVMRGVGVQLLGRRMYETMTVWETDSALAEESAIQADFAAAWQDSDKVVFSTTLREPVTKRTTIAPVFDEAKVRALKETTSANLLVGGPGLAAHALRAGLVDEIQLVVSPITVGGGKPAFPSDLRVDLELLSERRFGTGAIHMAYRVRQ